MRILFNIRRCLALVLFLVCLGIDGQTQDTLRITSIINNSLQCLQENQYEKSRDFAEQIVKADDHQCFAYILLGTIYAKYASQCTSSENYIERGMIYSLAINMFEKAKEVDNKCLKQANENINIFSNYLIDREGVFINVEEGEEIDIKGWINRKTRFRYKK